MTRMSCTFNCLRFTLCFEVFRLVGVKGYWIMIRGQFSPWKSLSEFRTAMTMMMLRSCCARTAQINPTLMDGCQLLTFLSYISLVSDTKVPFTQSFTLAQASRRTHITSGKLIIHISWQSSFEWETSRRRACSCWFYWWWWKTRINSLLIIRRLNEAEWDAAPK